MDSSSISEQVNFGDRTLTVHAKVFAAGEKYGIYGLKTLAQLFFKDFLNSGKEACQDFAEAMRIVFSSTPDHVRELRDLVVERLLKPGSESCGNTDVEEAIESIDKLAYELFKKLWSETRVTQCSTCRQGRTGICRSCSARRTR